MADYFTPIAAAIDTGGGLLSGYLNHQYDLEMANLSHRLNEQSADFADMRTRRLYRDFYSISAQMQQLKDAGLNPNLMYQNGAGSVGQSTPSGAQAAPASVANTAHFDLRTKLADMALVNSQIELNKANANKANEDANATKTLTPKQADLIGANTAQAQANIQKIGVETQAIELANAWQECENQVKSATVETAIETASAQLENIKAKTDELLAAADKSNAETETINKTRSLIIKQYRENIRKTMEEVTLIYSQEDLNQSLEKKYGKESDKIEAERNKIVRETTYIQEKYQLDIERLGLERARTENENHYRNSLIALGWTKTAVDGILRAGELATKVLPMVKKPSPIGFGSSK